MHRRMFGVFSLTIIAFISSVAQEKIPEAPIGLSPTIDGIVDDSEWPVSNSFGTLFDEVTGERSENSGKFWIRYDKDFIYFATKLIDSQPTSIKATEYRTNVSLDGDDSVSLLVDLSGSLADFNQFDINPQGATNIDLAGGRAAKREWQGEFVAKSRITETGWEAEAKIPWQIMRLPSAGKRDVRIVCLRNLKRLGRSYTTAHASDQSYKNAGIWTGVNIPQTAVDRSILLLPYAYFGHGEEEGMILNAGVDMKTNLTNEIPLVATVNPDFRNVENEILSLDFSRFERLSGETRPFFQEGRQYYNSALFASQRIDSFDAGINVHGKLTDTMSFGVLNTTTFGEQNSLATNVSYDPTPTQSFRFTGTSHQQDGTNNDAYLLRYFQSFEPYSVFLRTMGTEDTINGRGTYNTAGVYYNMGIVNTYAEYDAISPSFFPRLGFSPETDYRGIITGARINTPVKWGSISDALFTLDHTSYDTYGGDPYRRQTMLATSLALAGVAEITVRGDWESYLGSRDHYYQATITRPRNDPYNFLSIDYQDGEFQATYYRSIGLNGAIKPIPQLQITGSLQFVEFGGYTDQTILGVLYDLGNEQSVSGRIVKRGEDWNAYVAFRKSGNKGAEYFLIIGDPNSDSFKSSVILKVAVPLTIKG